MSLSLRELKERALEVLRQLTLVRRLVAAFDPDKVRGRIQDYRGQGYGEEEAIARASEEADELLDWEALIPDLPGEADDKARWLAELLDGPATRIEALILVMQEPQEPAVPEPLKPAVRVFRQRRRRARLAERAAA